MRPSLRSTLPLALLLLLAPVVTSAAVVYLDPAKATAGPGDTFVVNVRIDNQSDCINAAHVEVVYPTDTLRAVDFSRGSSIFSLWPEEPKIDTTTGVVTFSGGTPGGYCGRIPGDPAPSNQLGKIVFTVIGRGTGLATLHVANTSEVYLNDGLGTKAALSMRDTTVTIADTSTTTDNPWLAQVALDKTPPDPFKVLVESTPGVFNGKYYIVFSTVDKQSGLDHFEIHEGNSWEHVASPYQLKDQYLRNPVQLKAVDKAGNERLGEYVAASSTPAHAWYDDFLSIAVLLAILLLLVGARFLLERRKSLAAIDPPQA